MGTRIETAQALSDLFQPVQLGSYLLTNRIVMAPLTRSRADEHGVPGALIAEHYAQRASAGLIISEGVNISPGARGYALTPGIFNDAQIAGWRHVTDGVHARGGKIFPQLWHVGRVSHSSLQPGGILPVAPSALVPQATSYTSSGFQACPTPRALDTEEIPQIVDQYRLAARNALAAGFDGVEIHAANGYLIEQFLRDSTNWRTDAYGGSRENRARFLLEVVEAVVGVCGGARTGIRLSPISPVNGAALDSDPAATYGYVAEQLNAFDLAYIHVIEGVTQGPRELTACFDFQHLRRSFKGLYMANNGYVLELALNARRHDLADLISFGRLYIANPDLVQRLQIGARLNVPDHATFFGGGAVGYNDYPGLTPVERDTACRWNSFGGSDTAATPT
ncbi:alkene reductase [Paraburkholderia phenazinium]|uniref:N-ethylmaleimide reductase n=1 Tax=Paraburkholderia phenazinium TaxID=60549 RepID=A0A1G8P0Y7_9BURK|nr:alkene reductase [Paraburkholderia phenazinium]SDI86211.1 N-ethylmaleimide reductase [Paraburkholderia phenazinium]